MNKICAIFVFLRRDLRLRADYFANTAVKNAPFGRWTAQKRAAFYLDRWVSLAEGGRRNGDAALGILVARKGVRL